MVHERRMEVAWNFGTRIHLQATIQALADRHLACLRSILAHCRIASSAGYTPSDFPLAGMDQKQLDRVLRSALQATRRQAP
jgi:non-ribosomal peptide synthase protein (TIGR01720 family)